MRLTVCDGHLLLALAMPQYWLMKIEPNECSIDDLAKLPGQCVPWTGVRNYQARNFMRDSMKLGDLVLYYHSSCAEPGIAGVAEIVSAAYPDATQFDACSPYFDPRSSHDKPRWLNVDVKFVQKTQLLSLQAMRQIAELSDMALLRPGNRLSIIPVTEQEWGAVMQAVQRQTRIAEAWPPKPID